MGAASYLLGFITGIIFIGGKADKFVRFHAMQSTVLFGGIFIVNIAPGFIPILGWLVGLLLSFAAFILWICACGKRSREKCIKLLS